MRTARAVPLFTIAAMLVIGCGSSPEQPAPSWSSNAPAQPSISAGAPVPEPLRFAATTVDGDPFFGAALVGKPVVLWFWAPDCPACRGEAARVAAAARDHADTRFVGVGGQGPTSAMRDFVNHYDLPFPNIADTEAALRQRFGVTALPAFVFISKYTVVQLVSGALTEPELAARIAALD